jgi:hypothetical protein
VHSPNSQPDSPGLNNPTFRQVLEEHFVGAAIAAAFLSITHIPVEAFPPRCDPGSSFRCRLPQAMALPHFRACRMGLVPERHPARQ